MARERYPGERRGLSLFLEDLLPAVRRECGQDSILYHAIRRALTSGDLDHLRHARTIFNHLSREQRRALSAAIVARSHSVNPPRSQDLLEAYARRAPAPFAPRESCSEAKVETAVPRLPRTAVERPRQAHGEEPARPGGKREGL